MIIELTDDEYDTVESVTRDLIGDRERFVNEVDITRTPFEKFLEGHLAEMACYKFFKKPKNEWVNLKIIPDKGWDLKHLGYKWQIKGTKFSNGNLCIEQHASPKKGKVDYIVLVLGEDDGIGYKWNIYGYIDIDTYLEHKYLKKFNSVMAKAWTVDKNHFLPIKSFIENLNPSKSFFY